MFIMNKKNHIWNTERVEMETEEVGFGKKVYRILKSKINKIGKSTLTLAATVVFLAAIMSAFIISAKNMEASNNELKQYIEETNKINKLEMEKVTNKIVAIENINSELLEENTDLKANNDKLEVQIQELEEARANYNYVLAKSDGNRTDMSMDELKFGIEQMEKRNIDPHLLYGVVMVESNAKRNTTNNKSTARGYGQFLKGTARWVYEVKLNKGKNTYNHAMAFDGKTNLEMGAEYISYLMEKNNGSIMKTCLDYNGRELGEAYYHRVNDIIAKNTDTNLQEIEQKYKEDNNIL